jgi:hypothetical protein
MISDARLQDPKDVAAGKCRNTVQSIVCRHYVHDTHLSN